MSSANQSEPGHTADQEEKMAAKNGKNGLLQKVRIVYYISQFVWKLFTLAFKRLLSSRHIFLLYFFTTFITDFICESRVMCTSYSMSMLTASSSERKPERKTHPFLNINLFIYVFIIF